MTSLSLFSDVKQDFDSLHSSCCSESKKDLTKILLLFLLLLLYANIDGLDVQTGPQLLHQGKRCQNSESSGSVGAGQEIQGQETQGQEIQGQEIRGAVMGEEEVSPRAAPH